MAEQKVLTSWQPGSREKKEGTGVLLETTPVTYSRKARLLREHSVVNSRMDGPTDEYSGLMTQSLSKHMRPSQRWEVGTIWADCVWPVCTSAMWCFPGDSVPGECHALTLCDLGEVLAAPFLFTCRCSLCEQKESLRPALVHWGPGSVLGQIVM